MIYVDTSVLLAHLLAEDRRPPATFWAEPLAASRLIEYETWTRVHARGLQQTHGELARALLGQVALLELRSPVLARAVDPFPTRVRTLDALHLASAEFLRRRVPDLRFATYDRRLAEACDAMDFDVFEP